MDELNFQETGVEFSLGRYCNRDPGLLLCLIFTFFYDTYRLATGERHTLNQHINTKEHYGFCIDFATYSNILNPVHSCYYSNLLGVFG